MVLSSRIASSISVLVRRKLPGREDAVLERDRDGDGRRDSRRLGEARDVIELNVFERFSDGDSGRLLGPSSSSNSGRAERVMETGLDWTEVWLCTLERREADPTGFR